MITIASVSFGTVFRLSVAQYYLVLVQANSCKTRYLCVMFCLLVFCV